MKPKLDFYEIVQPFSLSSGNDDIWILHKENKVLNSFLFFFWGGGASVLLKHAEECVFVGPVLKGNATICMD